MTNKWNTEKFLKEAIKRVKNISNFNCDNVFYKGIYKPIDLYCNKHNIKFAQKPKYFLLNNIGCPKCKTNGYSIAAIKWLNEISSSNNIYIQHQNNNGEFHVPQTQYRVDGYCKETNTKSILYNNY